MSVAYIGQNLFLGLGGRPGNNSVKSTFPAQTCTGCPTCTDSGFPLRNACGEGFRSLPFSLSPQRHLFPLSTPLGGCFGKFTIITITPKVFPPLLMPFGSFLVVYHLRYLPKGPFPLYNRGLFNHGGGGFAAHYYYFKKNIRLPRVHYINNMNMMIIIKALKVS